jgi:hypothetical protein
MNRMIVIGPFVVLAFVAISVVGLVSWKKISIISERAAATERQNEILERNFRTLRDINGILILQLDSGGFRDLKSMLYHLKSAEIETEDVRAHIATYEALVMENFSYLPKGEFTYPAMVRALGNRLRETETRLKIVEAKLREASESPKAVP